MKLSGTSSISTSQTKELLGIALSSGTISFCSLLEEEDGGVHFIQMPEYEILLKDEGLILSISWSGCFRLAASTQSSSLLIFDARSDSNGLEVVHRINDAHQLLHENVPAWITAFDINDDRRIISGGDDMALKLWDTRISGGSGPISMNRKTHQAGVTAVCFSLFFS